MMIAREPGSVLYDTVFGKPLHYVGQCERTACVHCSRCGLGPQDRLTYRYVAGSTGSLLRYEIGLCPNCAIGWSQRG